MRAGSDTLVRSIVDAEGRGDLLGQAGHGQRQGDLAGPAAACAATRRTNSSSAFSSGISLAELVDQVEPLGAGVDDGARGRRPSR